MDRGIINTFTERLKTETDPKTLGINGDEKDENVVFWSQSLTLAQVENYRHASAVSKYLFLGHLVQKQPVANTLRLQIYFHILIGTYLILVQVAF